MVVYWEDAFHDGDFEGSPEDAGTTMICIGIGFLVKNTSKMVVLAGEKSEDGEELRWVLSIPKKMVKKIIPLSGFDSAG